MMPSRDSYIAFRKYTNSTNKWRAFLFYKGHCVTYTYYHFDTPALAVEELMKYADERFLMEDEYLDDNLLPIVGGHNG